MKKKEIILNLYNDYNQIDNAKDLHKRGLTLAEYNALLNIINELAVHHKSEFFILNIANYLKKFNVKIKTNAINFIATI